MHAAEHDDWCPAVAAGDLEAVPEALRREIEACAECASRIAELRTLRRGLSRLGDENRELLAEAKELSAAGAEQRIEQRLREITGAHRLERAPRPSTRRWPLLAAAAALAVIAAGWFALRPSPASPNPPVHLLGDEEHFQDMQPRVPVDELSSLSWREPLEPGEYFTVTLRVLAGSDAEPVASPRLRASEWRPTADQLARLPLGAFEWSVQTFSDERFVRASPWVASSRAR